MHKKAYILILALALAWVLVMPCPQAQAESGVYYEIFVRAFADSDGDGVGDLRGITQKLDYLADTLGVEGLWLMPTFPSPSYHGYDITDYRAVSPDYGTMDDMTELLEQAHARGMRVLLDLVINHTSWEHPWFLDPEKRDWYHWTDGQDPSVSLERQMWGRPVWNKRGSQWYYAIFWEGMPDLNFDNPAVRQEMKDIATFWLELGVDGFRLDAVSHIYGSGETGSIQDIGASAEWWREFTAHCLSVNPDCILVGEAWEPMDERAQIGEALGSVFHFDLGEEIVNLLRRGGSAEVWLDNLLRRLDMYQQVAGPDFVDAPFLSNHDQDRVAGALRNNIGMGRAAAAMYLLLPGRPFVYYGEEIGMQGAGPDEEKRTPMLWGEEDPQQTSWRESRYNTKTVPVDVQLEDPASLLWAYRGLIGARAAFPALRDGGITAHSSGNPRVAAWRRSTPEQSLLVYINLEATEQQIKVPDRTWRLVWSLEGSLGEARPIAPYGVDIYEKN